MPLIATKLTLRANREELLPMMQQFNVACNALSVIAFGEKLFHWYPLQKRAYYWLRSEFDLTSYQAITAIRKVVCAYRNKQCRGKIVLFKLNGAIPLYRHRYKRDGMLSFYGKRFGFAARNGIVLSSKHQATLSYQNGHFFVHQPLDAIEIEPYASSSYLGCDLGIVNVLADSDGEIYGSAILNGHRRRHKRLRAKLQHKGTKSAKRLLRRRSQKEKLFVKDINHVISKRVLVKALSSARGVAMEDLGRIRGRITVRKSQRYQFSSWAFGQLRFFVEYKAKLMGVPFALVDPRNTSRECIACGYVDKHNRKSQAKFICVSCGFAGPADTIAAINIARRAGSDQPYVAAQAIGLATNMPKNANTNIPIASDI